MLACFRGWKRKIGMVGLAISLIISMWWFRSLRISDHIQVAVVPGAAFAFFSEDGAYVFTRVLPLYEGQPLYTFWWSVGDAYLEETSNEGVKTITKVKQFEIVKPDTPYWPFAIAWGFISGWCLISKVPNEPSAKASKQDAVS
jgi:hypothetical protein